MHHFYKGIALICVSLFANNANAQMAGFPVRQQLPPGKSYDTIRRKDANNWEFIQVKNPEIKTLVSEGTMKNGVKEGTWVEYWETGFPMNITNYYNGKKVGISTDMLPTGNLVQITSYSNDEKEGPERIYAPMGGGNMLEETYYSDGVKNGMHTKWFPNRTKQEEDTYVNGKLEGHAVWYYENGEKAVEYSYKDGDLDGDAATYFQNGKVSDMGRYKRNVQVGTWKQFDENGGLKAEGEYDKDGEKEGEWKEYGLDGKYKLVKYHNGVEKK